jgi:ubiquinone/menaquinone biosynthesis C-methylase UbiE
MARRHAHFENREPFFEKILSSLRFGKIIQYIPSNARILDLGCGYNGKLLQTIEKSISSGVGMDISVNPESKNTKIELISHNLNYPLPFSENEFDVVTSLANLEHLDDPSYALQEIFRVLKPGGILLLTTPSVYAKPVLEILAFLRIVSRQEIEDHKNYFDKKILYEYCRKIKFSSFKHHYFQLGMNNFLLAKK